MTISKQRVTCQDCRQVQDVEVVTGAPISVCVASMRAARCEKCGGENLGIGGSYRDAPPVSAAIEERAAWWRERGEIGTSSLTIWSVFTGGSTPHRDYSWPHDPDDFSRCSQLLDLIPEWRERIADVAVKFPWFKPFSNRWQEFEALYREESPRNVCSKLYAAMKIACREAEFIRRSGDASK